MWLPEEESEKEVTPESQADETSQVDDIYVPGLGVRGVLYDDEKPARPAIWPQVRAAFSRGTSAIGRSGSDAVGAFRDFGVRAAAGYSRLSSDLRVAATRKASASKQFSGTLGAGFQKTQQRILKGAQSTAIKFKTETQKTLAAHKATVSERFTSNLGSGIRKARQSVAEHTRSNAGRLKSATQRYLAAAKPRVKTGTVQFFQASRAHLARFAKSASAQTSKARAYRPRLPHIPAAMVRSAHRAQSFSDSLSKTALAELRKLPRAAARYQKRFTYKADIATLRRAAPALVILGAMMIFTIQQIFVAAKR